MQWLIDHTDDLLTLIGGVYAVTRVIINLTPTPADDAGLTRLRGKFGVVLKLVLGIAKIMGMDSTEGVNITPVDPPPDLPDRPDKPAWDGKGKNPNSI